MIHLLKSFSRKKIKNFCKKGVFSLLISVFFLAGVSPLYSVFSGNPELSGVESSYAAEVSDKDAKSTWEGDLKSGTASEKLKQKISEFAALMISIFTPILAILIKLIETLMSDSYIMGTNGTTGAPISQVLYELWLVFRDIMNYLFILILLFFAFMNVIAPIAENDNFALKTVLPKMIMAIVVINLTWFGARVVFDAVDISARVVFGLPQAIMEKSSYGDALDPSKSPCEVTSPGGTSNKFVAIKGLCTPAYVTLNSSEKKGCSLTQDGKKYIKGKCFYFEPRADDEKDTPACANPVTKKGDISGDKYYSLECSTYKSEVVKLEGEKTALHLLVKKETVKKGEACTKGTDNGVTNNSECLRLTSKIDTMEKIIKNPNSKLKQAVNYGPITVYWSDFNYDDFNQGTIAPMFAFSILQVQNLPRIANTDYQKLTKEGTGWSTLVINILISLVIMIILLVLFALMVVNLFFRVIVLWVNIIFSPFYGLLIFQEQLSIPDSSSDYLGLAAFIKHAFAPVIMGLPLVVGFIMITVGKQYGIIEEGGNFGIDTPMIDNVSNLHQLFYYILAIVVLWVGGVKAIEATSSEFVQNNMINPIKTGVESAAKFVATAPMYINFIPVAGKDGTMHDLNLRQLGDISGSFESNRRQKSNSELSDLEMGSDKDNFIGKHANTIRELKKDDEKGTKDVLNYLKSSHKDAIKNAKNTLDSPKFTNDEKLKTMLRDVTNKEEAKAVLDSFGITGATPQELDRLVKNAQEISGGKFPDTKDENKDKKSSGNSDAPKKVSERKVSDVPSYEASRKKLKDANNQQPKDKREAFTLIVNNIGKEADKYTDTNHQKKYVKNMLEAWRKDTQTTEYTRDLIKELEKKDLDVKKAKDFTKTDEIVKDAFEKPETPA